jgi:hypothetical protein
MANLFQDDRNIIEQHPLDNSLDRLRDTLRKEEESYDAADDDSTQKLQKAISGLLGALLLSEAAGHLASRTESREIATDLLGLRRRVQNGDFNYEHYRPLVRCITQKASDVNVWSAVFNLIPPLSHITPPTSIAPSFDGTPIRHTSSSHQGSEQTRQLLEGRIFEEIDDCIYRNVGGFFSKYFEGNEWTEQAVSITASLTVFWVFPTL